MAPAKTVIALFLSMQGAQAKRSDAEASSLVSGVFGTKSHLQQVLEKLKGSPCEYALGHEVKTIGIGVNIAGGANALQEVQTKINELAVACRRIQKAEGKIAEFEGKVAELDQRVSATSESMSKTDQEIDQFQSDHQELNDDVCKHAYAQTGIAGKTKRAFSSMTGHVFNWFKDIRASKEEKQARKDERDTAKANEAVQLNSATAMSENCKTLDGLTSSLQKAQKALDKDGKEKATYEDKLVTEKAELVEANAEKDGATTGAIESLRQISDDFATNLGPGSSDAEPTEPSSDDEPTESE